MGEQTKNLGASSRQMLSRTKGPVYALHLHAVSLENTEGSRRVLDAVSTLVQDGARMTQKALRL